MKTVIFVLALAGMFVLELEGAAHAGKCVDVNTGTAKELDRLPRVGLKTAAKIITARKAGKFKSLEDLAKRTRGIGVKTIGKWREAKLVCKLK